MSRIDCALSQEAQVPFQRLPSLSLDPILRTPMVGLKDPSSSKERLRTRDPHAGFLRKGGRVHVKLYETKRNRRAKLDRRLCPYPAAATTA